MLRVLDLPNRRQKEIIANHVPGAGPDPQLRKAAMAEHGVSWRYRDLHNWPLNPFARRGSFYAGIDPLRALSVLLFERKVDVICCGFESGILLVILLRRLFAYRPKIVMFEVNPRGWRVRDRALDFLMARLDGVLTLTEHQRSETDRTYQLKRPAETVGFAVDSAFFRPNPESPDEGFIFSIGEDAGRDYATLFEACRKLDHRLVVRASAAHLREFQAGADVVRLDRISFADLRSYYARARLVVIALQPLSSPTGVTSILEAMAMGKPVIASDVGTTRDILVHEVTGLVVPPDDPEALRRAILRLMGDADLRDRLGRAARAAIEGPLSYSAHASRFAGALRRIAEGDPARTKRAMPL